MTTIKQRIHQISQCHTGIWAAISVGLIVLQFSSWAKGWVEYRGQIVASRYATYREVAEWLNRHAGTDESLAVGEIGILGYYTDMKIIDLRGLVTPALMPWLARGRIETLNQAIELYAPDYVLTDEEVLIEFLDQPLSYQPVRGFGEDIYLLYRKRRGN